MYYRCVSMSSNISSYSFHESMKELSLASLTKGSSSLPPTLLPSLAPPTCLLDYPPLAGLTNGIIAGLNEVRQCAPVAVGSELARETRRLLDSTVHDIAELHRSANIIISPIPSVKKGQMKLYATCV